MIGLCGLFRKELCEWEDMQMIYKRKKGVRVQQHVDGAVTETSFNTKIIVRFGNV